MMVPHFRAGVLAALLVAASSLAAQVAEPPKQPPALQAGRVLLQDDDTVVVRADTVWEDAREDALHFEGSFDMRTREWRILAQRAVSFGAVNDPDRIAVTGSPARVWIQRTAAQAEAPEIIYGEGAELEYIKSQDLLLVRGDAVLIEQGNRLSSAVIEYDLAGERFKASGQQGVEIVVEADRAPRLD